MRGSEVNEKRTHHPVHRIVNTHRRIALHHIILCITIITPASSPLRLCRVFLFVLCE